MEKFFKAEPGDLAGVYSEMAELIGLNNTYKVYKYFRGQQVTFLLKFYSLDCMADMILEEYDGSNIHDMSKKYGYSEARIRQILNKKKNRMCQKLKTFLPSVCYTNTIKDLYHGM